MGGGGGGCGRGRGMSKGFHPITIISLDDIW